MNMTVFMELLSARSPFIIVPAIFVIIGLSYTTYTLFRFVSANDIAPPNSQPRYDQVYFGLQLFMSIGWTGFAVVAFLNILFSIGNELSTPHLIFLCWAILALGMGLLFLLRMDMIIAVTAYKARHASFPWRYFYQMQAKRLGSESPWQKSLQKFVAAIFAMIGALILGYFILRFPTSAQEVATEIHTITANIQTSHLITP